MKKKAVMITVIAYLITIITLGIIPAVIFAVRMHNAKTDIDKETVKKSFKDVYTGKCIG